MLRAGKAVKVSIYLSEGTTRHGVPTASSILDFLYFRGVSGATVLKGIAGFGADHHLHSSSSVEISDHLPVKIEFIETREKVDELLGKLEEMAGSGMIEVQETNIAKPGKVSRRGEASRSDSSTRVRIEGKAQLMEIYIGESDRWQDRPLYDALVYAMRANDLAGVTVYRGILGYGAHRRMHKEAPLHFSHDSSIMLSVVDTEQKLSAFLPIVEQMVGEGLVVLSDVDIIKYAHRGDTQTEPSHAQDRDVRP
jgi:PII-like signaling protein